MSEDEVTVGPTPAEESCAQVGSITFPERSRIECRVFRRMLARHFPVPEGVQARLVIKQAEHEYGLYREVVVRCVGASGWSYALQVERGAPPVWDEIAHAELIWYCVRRAVNIAEEKGWVKSAELPSEFCLSEPSEFFPGVLTDRQPVYSPIHPGGPFAEKSEHEVTYSVSKSVFSPQDSAVLLGRLDSDSGPGLLMRVKSALRVFSTDFREEIAVLSEDLRQRTFSVTPGSEAHRFLRSTDVSRLVTPEQTPKGRKGEYWSVRQDIWSGGISLTLGE